MYKNALLELRQSLDFYQNECGLYPVLYFYGLGNGVLAKALLQNEHLKFLVIFERDLGLLWSIFHCLDFSKELRSDRLLLIADYNDERLFSFVRAEIFLQYARTYFLTMQCAYYQKDREDFERVDALLAENLNQAMLFFGNDSEDALLGIANFIHNLPEFTSRPTIGALIHTYKKRFPNALIVSTGPSLTKQLPLLKEVQKRVFIIAADSAYPILMREGIRPDLVLSLERISFTSEFFKESFEGDEKVLFVLKSIVCPKTLQYLGERNFMGINGGASFDALLRLRDFPLFSMGPSVANFALHLALLLEFERIFFIGQDLAYGEDYRSHPQGYLYGIHDLDEAGERKENLRAPAYGGVGEVRTSFIWQVFRRNLEEVIGIAKAKIYNATEGGARINGTVEKPFSECCVEFFTQNKPSPVPLSILNSKKQEEILLRACHKLHYFIKVGEIFVQKLKTLHEEITQILMQVSLLDLESEKLRLYKASIEKLDALKNCVEKDEGFECLGIILSPTLMQFEFNLAPLFVKQVRSTQEALEKNELWVSRHLALVEEFIRLALAQNETIRTNITPLEEEIKKRGFEKYLLKIKEKNA
ncbi:6-hydroxymethylpterin diphosphokinase MptE-like protein [Campylobacter sp.]|uniref:motility associated factor glycosyltransferase family protein n=1 Tax=Campylobacter sp. TaxID=205 RepID=UPI0026DB318E|nr:6-hydroxymethylpterin diphosphokinase MptE-like protein [Campylobacter sp.]MDO4674484.1 DUF115 domain-containing protein [Campylobacter sp.]